MMYRCKICSEHYLSTESLQDHQFASHTQEALEAFGITKQTVKVSQDWQTRSNESKTEILHSLGYTPSDIQTLISLEFYQFGSKVKKEIGEVLHKSTPVKQRAQAVESDENKTYKNMYDSYLQARSAQIKKPFQDGATEAKATEEASEDCPKCGHVKGSHSSPASGDTICYGSSDCTCAMTFPPEGESKSNEKEELLSDIIAKINKKYGGDEEQEEEGESVATEEGFNSWYYSTNWDKNSPQLNIDLKEKTLSYFGLPEAWAYLKWEDIPQQGKDKISSESKASERDPSSYSDGYLQAGRRKLLKKAKEDGVCPVCAEKWDGSEDFWETHFVNKHRLNESKASEKTGYRKRPTGHGTYVYEEKSKINCQNCDKEIYETDGDTFHTTKCRYCGHVNLTNDLTYESKASEGRTMEQVWNQASPSQREGIMIEGGIEYEETGQSYFGDDGNDSDSLLHNLDDSGTDSGRWSAQNKSAMDSLSNTSYGNLPTNIRDRVDSGIISYGLNLEGESKASEGFDQGGIIGYVDAKCKTCGVKFNSPQMMDAHYRDNRDHESNLRDLNDASDISVWTESKASEALKSHTDYHKLINSTLSGETSIECSKCAKKFKGQESLNIHYNDKHADSELKSLIGELKANEEIEYTGGDYCDKCGTEFEDKGECKKCNAQGEAKIGDWDDDRINISVMGDNGEFKDVKDLQKEEGEAMVEDIVHKTDSGVDITHPQDEWCELCDKPTTSFEVSDDDYDEKVEDLMKDEGVDEITDFDEEEKKDFFDDVDDIKTTDEEQTEDGEAVGLSNNWDDDEKRMDGDAPQVEDNPYPTYIEDARDQMQNDIKSLSNPYDLTTDIKGKPWQQKGESLTEEQELQQARESLAPLNKLDDEKSNVTKAFESGASAEDIYSKVGDTTQDRGSEDDLTDIYNKVDVKLNLEKV